MLRAQFDMKFYLSVMKRIVIYLVLSCLVLIGSLISANYYFINQPNKLTDDMLFTIELGTSFNHFTKQLVKLGVADNRFWLRNFVRFNKQFAKIKAGTYQVRAKQSIKEILFEVSQGKEHQFSLTFVEGTTLKQWLAQLHQHPNILHTLSEQSVIDSYKEVSSVLNLSVEHPEGLFFPETYAFVNKTTDIEILRRANQKMQFELEKAWSERLGDLPYKTPYQALIMASIIEKESGKHAEHEIISSVFVNRLEKNMRLQTDPTIIYGLGERYKGDIKRSHKREKTAYNTYRINGLPPTPIAMPGKSAIVAAMNPASTDFYYFVSNGQGKHIFSHNLAEHNRAVVKYQLNKVN